MTPAQSGLMVGITIAFLASPSPDAVALGQASKKSNQRATSNSRSKTEVQPTAHAAESPERVRRSDAEWRVLLTPDQYWVTRQKGTEPAYSGRYSHGKFRGVFECVGCGAELFDAAHKFESGTGWPSFWRAVSPQAIGTAPDYSEAEPRTEVFCVRCDAHLGHVFPDGPAPTGLRFCINSVSLKLRPASAPREVAKVKSSRKESNKSKEGPKSKIESSSTTSSAVEKKVEPSTTGKRLESPPTDKDKP